MAASQTTTQIIGIDCATASKKVGLALGRFTTGGLEVTKARCGGTPEELLTVVCDWINSAARVLLALDAPLGWPDALRKALATHSAGQKIDVDGGESQAEAAELLFRRKTDREVMAKCGKRPLDVGADRIARTAHAALRLLGDLRRRSNVLIPLAWSPDFTDRCAAIEVYPAATLTAYRIGCSSYKGNTPAEHTEREKILDSLRDHLILRADAEELLNDADILDAVVCTLAAADFLRGEAHPPAPNDPVVWREGWIWTKLPLKKGYQPSG
jgi:hypothetical protein